MTSQPVRPLPTRRDFLKTAATASVAALTVYDMCKAVDRGMVISDVKLVHKSGGKSGVFNAR